MILQILRPAYLEVTEASQYYDGEAPGLGTEFLDEFGRVTDQILANPNVGSPFEQQFRRMPLRRFPYTVVYRHENGTISIVAVMHQRRRPGYWGGRV